MTWLLLTIAALVLVGFVVLAYERRWHWTGMPGVTSGEDGDALASPAKTLWDWLQLFVIPLALAGLAFLLNNAQTQRDQEREDQRAVQLRATAADNAREEALRAYLTQMSDLMLDRRLLRSSNGAEVRHVARTATLTALRRLNGERRGLVVRFLAEAGLVGSKDAKVDLRGADLRDAELRDAELRGVQLRGVNLRGADMQRARLTSAVMRYANLRDADMASANITGADLVHADIAPKSPRPPPALSKKAAIAALYRLTIAPRRGMSGYTRESYGRGWMREGDGCDTRYRVLKRDARIAHAGSRCRITGSWTDPYTGTLLTTTRQVDVDHVVPLAHAWRTGASKWSFAKRQAFANDLRTPQLVAISRGSNISKAHSPPDEWMPPREKAWCTYARWWVDVKATWQLTVTVAERDTLKEMLNAC